MKITFRIVLKPDASEAIARDPAPAGAIDLSAVTIELDHDDPKFHRLLEVTRDTRGTWLNPYMTFTAAENGGGEVPAAGVPRQDSQRDAKG